MGYVVKATLGSSGNKRRVTSRKFRTKNAAKKFASATNKGYYNARAKVSKA